MASSSLAPILIFVYNRPDHTSKMLDALRKNVLINESTIFIFADGPKIDATQDDLKKIEKTRELVKNITWANEVHITTSVVNKGLSNSIIEGVREVINRYEKVIVLEDDLITSPYFLEFMNEGLNFYFDQDKVISIAGYLYPVQQPLPETFFLKGADCWGWATWKRGWDLFEKDGKHLLNELKSKKTEYEFDVYGSYPYTRMLVDQIRKVNNSWAIRWHASAFLKNKFTLYPGVSLIRNIGLDNSGTHGGNPSLHDVQLANSPVKVNPIQLSENKTIISLLIKYHSGSKKQNKYLSSDRIKSLIKNLIPPVAFKIKHRLAKKEDSPKNQIEFKGDFDTFEEAKRKSTGYNDKIILEKVKEALLKVKKGEAIYERDSVLFDKIQYSWPLLAALMWAAAQNQNKLNIIDFGGSLGSSYFQNRRFLSTLYSVCWNVVEQESFVKCGKENFANNELFFFKDLEECKIQQKSDFLLLASTLQYLEDPFDFIDTVIKLDFQYIIIDRTTFIDNYRHQLTIQNVPDSIYKASYPCWFFNYNKLIERFKSHYEEVSDFNSMEEVTINIEGYKGYCGGCILERKK
jgi:putative methyltransferase (TIGR04325 family)